MDKKIIPLLLAVALFCGSAYASEISRSLSAAAATPGSDITVTLTVSISGGETYYVIDETVPSGWAIKDPGSGATDQPGHLKWVVIQDAQNTAYTYALTAPEQPGTGSFSGKYMLEGMASEAEIGGQNQVVMQAQATGGNGSTGVAQPGQGIDITLALAVVAVFIVIAAVLLLLKRR